MLAKDVRCDFLSVTRNGERPPELMRLSHTRLHCADGSIVLPRLYRNLRNVEVDKFSQPSSIKNKSY